MTDERQPPNGGWIKDRIKPEQIEKYLDNGRDFLDDAAIERALAANVNPDPKRVREILAKSLAIETLTPDETACLLHVEDPELLAEMQQAAAAVKTKVYDNRIVTFAPLYLSNLCVNDCVYCGFRCSNTEESRRILSLDEVRREVEVLAGQIGHKRLIVVYGEHPKSGIDYMAATLRTIYDVKVKTRRGWGQIRRCNVNAAPLSVEELRMLQGRGHRHVPGLPGDLPQEDLREAASEAHDQGQLPLAAVLHAPRDGGRHRRRRARRAVRPVRLEIRGDGAAVPRDRAGEASSGSGRTRSRSRGSSRRTTRRMRRSPSTASVTLTSSGW